MVHRKTEVGGGRDLCKEDTLRVLCGAGAGARLRAGTGGLSTTRCCNPAFARAVANADMGEVQEA